VGIAKLYKVSTQLRFFFVFPQGDYKIRWGLVRGEFDVRKIAEAIIRADTLGPWMKNGSPAQIQPSSVWGSFDPGMGVGVVIATPQSMKECPGNDIYEIMTDTQIRAYEKYLTNLVMRLSKMGLDRVVYIRADVRISTTTQIDVLVAT